MKYRTLGRTGLEISEVGLGTWALGTSIYGGTPPREAYESVRQALDAGITFYDTAPLYGDKERDGIAEEVLGKGLGADRDKVVVATKFGRYPTRGNRPEFHAERLGISVEESLRRLGTDRIDVLFFHSPSSPEEINDDVWEELEGLKQRGLVRFVGHSISWYPETSGMAASWAKSGKIDVIQVVLSLFNREAQPLADELSKIGIGVVARECLANGWLAGIFDRNTKFAPGTLNARWSAEEVEERLAAAEGYRFLAEGTRSSMACAALRWVLDQTGVSVVLSGAKNRSELEDAVNASLVAPLSAAELERAAALHKCDFPPA